MQVSKTVLFATTVIPIVVFITLVTYTIEVSISVEIIVEVDGIALSYICQFMIFTIGFPELGAYVIVEVTFVGTTCV